MITMVYNITVIDILQSDLFKSWLSGLKDTQARGRILARIDRMAFGNLGDCKPVGEGVSEARIHYGQGYRVYFTQRGNEVIILLAGGTKSGQARDIKEAIHLARDI